MRAQRLLVNMSKMKRVWFWYCIFSAFCFWSGPCFRFVFSVQLSSMISAVSPKPSAANPARTRLSVKLCYYRWEKIDNFEISDWREES